MLPACTLVPKEHAPKRKPRWELADIFRHYGNAYRGRHGMPLSHMKVMRDIVTCRTAYLGGHLEQCDACGVEKNAYNS
jgi:hypothetical protein